MADYIDYGDLVLLGSIEKPRRITREKELFNLRLLASQDLVSVHSTMARLNGTVYTIPTAKLTDYGKVALKYMRERMTRKQKRAFKKDVSISRESEVSR